MRLAATLYTMYDKDSHRARIAEVLDDLEARQNPGGAPAFKGKLRS